MVTSPRRAALALCLLAGACGDDATSLDGPPPPGDAAVELVDAGPPPDGGFESDRPWFSEGLGLRRLPYLQNVTSSVARILWTTTTREGGFVRVRRRGESTVREVRAAYELFPVERTGEDATYGLYTATVRNLEPDTDYQYEVWEGRRRLAAGLSFHTAWLRADRALRILAFGDSGSGLPPQLAVRDELMKRRYDVFFHLGDIAYPTGSYDQFQRFFFDVYRDLLHEVPVYPVIGNHEYLTLDAQPFIDVYHLPAMALRPADDERYYSFDLGDVHVVALDSNPRTLLRISDNVDDDMLDWLRADLAASKAPWKLALFHHPVYSSGPHGSDGLVQRKLVEALEEGGIDLVLNGHDHDYERSMPVWQGMAAPGDRRAITYIVAGGGGGSLYLAPGQWFTEVSDSVHYSFLDLTIEGCFATGKAITSEGEVLDAFVVNGCE